MEHNIEQVCSQSPADGSLSHAVRVAPRLRQAARRFRDLPYRRTGGQDRLRCD
jgi:hypothetical protein